MFLHWYTALSLSRVTNDNNRILNTLKSNNEIFARSVSHPLFSNQSIDQSTNAESSGHQNPSVILTETPSVNTLDQIPVK